MRNPFYLTLAILMLLGVACQPGTPPPAAAPTRPPEPRATATPVAPPKPAATPAAASTAATSSVPRGGTLVVALNADPDTFNPSLNVGSTAIVGCKVMEGLVSASPDRTEIRPELATSWEVSPDGLTYTFHLRSGVLWHDGKPFTSEDVKWSFETVNKFHPIARSWSEKLGSIQTPNPQTVVLRLKEPFAPLLLSLPCSDGGAISPKHLVEPGADVRKHQKLNQALIGTGPFTFKEWVPGNRTVLARNEKYWKEQRPYLDQVVVKVIPDTTSMVLALRAGEINYINYNFVNTEDALRLRNDPKIAMATGLDAPIFEMVQLNHRRPPFDKPDVRKALFMAIDRELILNNVYKLGKLLDNMIDERLGVAAAPAVSLQKMYPYDVARANRMLDEAGVARKADGSRLQTRLLFEAGRRNWAEVAEIVRSSWDKVGVKVTLEPVERAVMLEKGFKKRDFDAMLQTYASRADPALGVSRAYVCEDDKNPPTFGNPTGYCRQNVDQMFDEAARTPDFEKRREIYRRIQRILADDLPIIVFMGQESVALGDKQFDFSGPHNSTGAHTGWEHVHKVR